MLTGFDATGNLVCGAVPVGDIFPKLALCGFSARDVADFIPAGTNLVVTTTCTPAAGVRAMLITRSGHSWVDAGALQAFLEGGGVVLTEFGASIPVFNKVFGTSFPEPSFLEFVGGCSDNVMPVVQYEPLDAFWMANPFTPETMPGCGYNIAHLPGIVPLGSHVETPGVVTLAYVQKGMGRLWLVESDWADGELAFQDHSLRLLRYMVKTH